MVKMVCDKCNKVLTPPVDEVTTLIRNVNGVKKHYDFCEKCYKSLINWCNTKENLDEITN